MSKVTYQVGSKEYSFSTELQIRPYIKNVLALETILIEEIKNHKHANSITGIMHDVTLTDENGLVACAKNFESNNENLKIRNNETV